MAKRKSQRCDMLLPRGTGTNMLAPRGTGTGLLPRGSGTDMLLPRGTGLLPRTVGADEIQTSDDVFADLEAMGGTPSTEGIPTMAEVAADLDLIACGTKRPRAANAAIKRARVRPLNRRQRCFARALAAGVHPTKAQAIAGFKSHRGNAWRLARDPRIDALRARIERGQRRSNRKRGKAE